jgi:phosphate:Na+ symporter
VTLLAAYHTAYNVVGVLVLLPLIDKFTRFVERIMPERGPALTRCLDPAALTTPIVAVEAARLTVARALGVLCGSIETALAASSHGGGVRLEKSDTSVAEAADALRQAREFLSSVNGRPESKDEQRRLTSRLRALDHAFRLGESAGEKAEFRATNSGADDMHAVQLCAEAMQSAASAAGLVATLPAGPDHAAPTESGHQLPRPLDDSNELPTAATSAEEALARLAQCAKALDELRQAHRISTLGAVASGALTAGEVIVRVDTVRRLQALVHHAWRSAINLLGRGE